MKARDRLLALVVCGSLLAAVASWAEEDNYAAGMTEKASRGLVNVATGWFELPHQVVKGYNKGTPYVKAPAGSRSLGTLQGFGRGIGHAVGRTAWGVVELATFWAVNPTTNRELLFLQDGNYSWDEGARKPFLCPCAEDGAERVGMRLQRGASNTFGFFLEVPGQVRKYDELGCVWQGIPKGLYYAVSRLVNGAPDVALFLLPSPEDNLMVPFEEVWSWDAWEERYYSNVP
ncbi:MAG: hypothetical protein JXR77_02805 [Lentisphaeria bacterium]|nr:hypothetical protein [Lentisphaeria bacterium]